MTAETPHVGTSDVATVSVFPQSVGSWIPTLLYVEYNPANLMLVDLVARRPDQRLLSARDDISGVAIAHTALPDVILMDINLPCISGIQAMRIQTTDVTTFRIPVVALSANAVPDDIQKDLEAGFSRTLTKPIKINEFMTMLGEALELSKPQTAYATAKVKAR